MSFRCLGSQKSNALNGARFGVEMKELESLEADHTKLKANFVGCEITRGWLRNQPLAAKWCPSRCEILLSASRYLRPTFLDFFALDI